ncbi:TagK domain-containing protein [Serratia sp. UGAL515B_01]|uniref:TagK domain-containing protein n=1 Tax=Serratia sp. UGAL515B_01 TaxID=2986763 RepID=UPI0029545247|nr:TagK domain-containing protein [Serratia sp. UGAL515B_01]WON77492.1 TagK domain-containing protein [Serratia sp. UGAL515B_01]
MQLQINWPPTSQMYPVDESFTPEKAYYFCLQHGNFGLIRPAGAAGYLCFYWLRSELVMEYHSTEYICSVNSQPLLPGTRMPLRYGMAIQAGQFSLSVTPIAPLEEALAPDESRTEFDAQEEFPELENLLSHGGHYTPWQAAMAISDGAPSEEEDVLKQLSAEYKRFLLWGDQSRNFLNQDVQQENRLPARDPFLDNIMESVRDKTMVECILAEGSLIERVLEELVAFNQAEISEDEQPDLLSLLAPEHLARINRSAVSDLLYRELHKLGLDSHL